MADRRFRSLPEVETFLVAADDGASLPVYALGRRPGAPALLVGHANGLAAGSYGPWLAMLADDFEVFAYDARGHGGASWPDGALEAVFHVDRFADDLARVAAAVTARLGGRRLYLAGHSLGAAAALRLAARGGALPWAAALLFEPPVFPDARSPHFTEAAAKQTPLIARSARRRADWPSPEALAAALGGRGMFRYFRFDLLAAHCRAALRPLPQGGYTLACPPEVEAAIFRGARTADTWQRLPAIAAPLHFVGGDPAMPERGWVSAVLPEMTARVPGARLTWLEGAGHMMIFEQPERCRRLVLEDMRRAETGLVRRGT
ncbi:MAG TPA: alpha/beta hydrolase [Stellaceae bacterium]|nr:alpha/beta hydrolase [Stellaceae bacterium]